MLLVGLCWWRARFRVRWREAQESYSGGFGLSPRPAMERTRLLPGVSFGECFFGLRLDSDVAVSAAVGAPGWTVGQGAEWPGLLLPQAIALPLASYLVLHPGWKHCDLDSVYKFLGVFLGCSFFALVCPPLGGLVPPRPSECGGRGTRLPILWHFEILSQRSC